MSSLVFELQLQQAGQASCHGGDGVGDNGESEASRSTRRASGSSAQTKPNSLTWALRHRYCQWSSVVGARHKRV